MNFRRLLLIGACVCGWMVYIAAPVVWQYASWSAAKFSIALIVALTYLVVGAFCLWLATLDDLRK